MRIYTGYDAREALGTWVFQSSVLRRTESLVEFVNLCNPLAPGTNAFTYERYRIAQHSGYAGAPVVFADAADMVCLADITDVLEEYQTGKAVQVVKRPFYRATTPKYVGTQMEAENRSYERKNWSSFMLVAPSHFGWRRIKWDCTDPAYWHEFGWLKDNEVGMLDPRWNRLVDEGDPVSGAKVLHWTLGIPGIAAYANAPGADIWRAERDAAVATP